MAEQGQFFAAVRRMVQRIPAGQVASYSQVAEAVAGSRRYARAVGFALAGLTRQQAADVPWWRVINSQGCISRRSPRGAARQRALLEGEGIRFDERGRVDFADFGWDGPLGG